MKTAQQGPMPKRPPARYIPAGKAAAPNTANHRAEDTWVFRRWETVHKATALRLLLCSMGTRVACWVGLLGTLYSKPLQTVDAP